MRVCMVCLEKLAPGLALLALMFAASALPVAAQSTNMDTATVTQATPGDAHAVQAFKQLLADPEVQNWLQQAAEDASLADSPSGPTLREHLADIVEQVRARVKGLLGAASVTDQAPDLIASIWQSRMSNFDSLRALTYLIIFLFVGAGFEWLYTQRTQYKLLALELTKPQSLRERLSTGLQRATITVVSLLVFAFGSIGTFLLFDWPPVVDHIVLNVLIIVLVVRAGNTLSRFLLAPRFEDLRLVPLNNIQAKTVHLWFSLIVFIGATNFAVSDVFKKMVSMSQDEVPGFAALSVDVSANFIWLLVVLYSIYAVNRLSPERSVESGARPTTFWPIYLAVLALGVYLLWLVNIPNLLSLVLIIGLLLPIVKMCSVWVDYFFDQVETANAKCEEVVHALNEDAGVLEEAEVVAPLDDQEHEVHRYASYRLITRRLVRFVLVVLAVIALALAWKINFFELSSSTSTGGRVFEIVIDIVIVLLIVDLVWVWARSAIDTRLADYVPPTDGQAPGPEARMATLLPLLRTVLLVTLLVTVILSVLSSFGVNVAPLLAGAGVLGVAIGFGAQALVRDVVSGVFFLIDDAFRIGEYIEVDGLFGTVEAMSVRSLRIRHHRGAVHTIPFGELKSLTNYSRDWVIMKLEFRVPFDTDLKLVKKLVKQIGVELQQNPDYGHSIIEPLKSQGVRRMEEFNMVVGVKFKAKPGEQWLVRRDAYQKVRDAFDANGIGFAERNVKVEVLSTQPLDKETEKLALGAAQDVIDQSLPPGPIPDEP